MYRETWFWILFYSICSGWNSPQLYPSSTLSQSQSQRSQKHQELHVLTLPLVIYRALNNRTWVQLWIPGEVSYFLPKQVPYKTQISWNEKGKWGGGRKEPRAGDIPDLNTESLNAINFHSHTPVCWYNEFNWRGKGHPVHLMFAEIRNPDLTR